MWKIISLSVLVIIAEGTNIQDFYGNWTHVAIYPAAAKAHVCMGFTFAKNPDNIQCTADGREATFVEVSLTGKAGVLIERFSMPMLAVDTFADVLPALNVSVRCGDRKYSDHGVVRLVNEEYFILYGESKESLRTATEPNTAYLFGKKVVSADELNAVMISIEDLKNRQGAQKCTTESSGFSRS